MNLTPKDLKVGNYVNYENITHVVDEIHKDKLVHHWINSQGKKSDLTKTEFKEILSIPLSTKEIEKFGFIKDENRVKLNPDLYFDDKGYCIEDNDGDYCLCQHLDEDEIVRILRVDLVHELQNAYFSLTKRELTY